MKKIIAFTVAMAATAAIFLNLPVIDAHAACGSYLMSGVSGSSSKDSGKKPSSNASSKASSSKLDKTVSGIKSVCGLKSEVEKSVEACIVDVNSKSNPYDVVYDYGKEYDKYVAACDWSLVFDADYYSKRFPMLSMLYHGDKKLLLKHFQTVGIQEGRQGNAKFNVGVYKANCAKSVSKAFGNEYEGYYFYYMLNYSSEKSVTAASKNSKPQQTVVMTALHAQEFKDINRYRAEAKVQALEFNSELAAFANYRAWLNVHDGYRAHDWLHKHKDVLINDIMPVIGIIGYGENETEASCACCTNVGKVFSENYRKSKGHYDTLTYADDDIYGISNAYAKPGIYRCQFDVFGELA